MLRQLKNLHFIKNFYLPLASILVICFFWAGAGSGSNPRYDDLEYRSGTATDATEKDQIVSNEVETKEIEAAKTGDEEYFPGEIRAMRLQMVYLWIFIFCFVLKWMGHLLISIFVFILTQESLKAQVETLKDISKELRKELDESKAALEVQSTLSERIQSDTGSKDSPPITDDPQSTAEMKKIDDDAALDTSIADIAGNSVNSDDVSSPSEKEDIVKSPPKTSKTKGQKKSKTNLKKGTKAKMEERNPRKPSEIQSGTKSTSKKISSPVNGTKIPDWSKLSESTLKRKTVKELTEYLTQKGISVTDSSGKTMKKLDLVQLVLSP